MKTVEARIEIPKYFLETRDGVHLRYFDTGAGQTTGSAAPPAILLANGLGGPISAFRPYMKYLSQNHRVLSWDYRGLYGSLLPRGPRSDLGVSAHAEDVLAVLDRAGVEHVTFVGWSMGVQIGLEVVRRAKDRVSGLVLMNGTSGNPLRGMDLPFSEFLLAPLVRRAGGYEKLGHRLIERASRHPTTSLWLKRLGLVARAFDSALFQEMIDDFKTIDLRHYFALLDELCRHDAGDMLGAIDVPTLVVSGGRDHLTPSSAAQRMAERIRGAEFFLVPAATHYGAAEFPDIVARRIERFVQGRIAAS